jgi:hypothetical protein
MLAYDFPVLSLFFSMIWFFIWIAWLFLVFRTVVDIFRSHDLGGLGKALWLLFVVLAPYLGVFVYVIARGRDMSSREMQRAADNEESLRQYVRHAAGTTSTADELVKLAELRDRGVITEAEFGQQKARLLATA